MQPVRRVVVATDFSPGSDAAVECALQIARAHGARLDLLHAFDAAAWQGLRAVFDARRLAGDVPADVLLQQRLAAHAQDLAKAHGLEVEACFGVGDPADALEAHGRATHAAVIVAARRDDPATPGVGSTLLRLLRQASCSVLVVRGPPARAPARVLSAVDLREASMRAAVEAVRLFPKASHRLLCALDPVWEREVWRSTSLQGPMRQSLQSLHERVDARLRTLAAELAAASGAAVHAEVVDAVPSRALVEQAAGWPADCVAVGRHEGVGLGARLLGSTALDLIHHTGGDVLVVP